ncbi:phage major capsid protein [Victivallis vadensis]|uniref:phage major capsid protein n=1 Tax=Victivallis vadensis TaxID=172901 RepID=UPI0023F70A1D|nr:phage major capsid protein [Victivallis vadensis]
MNPEVDEKNLEITLPVASPEPFGREDENGVPYQEVLRVTPEAVDLTRLNGGAAVLRNHDTDHTYGVVKQAFIEGGRLYTRLRFRKNEPEAVAAFRDAVDGTLPNVSLGYQPLEIEFRQENGVRIGEVTRWMPFEVSVAVGVPADATVGFYRSMTKTGENKMEVESKEPTSDELRTKIRELEEENAQLKKRSEEPPPEEGKKEDPPPEGKKEEETRSACNESELRAMAATFNRLDLLPGALQRNLTPEAFKSELQNNLYRGSIKVMEKREYSIVRAIRSLVDESVDAAVEREESARLYREAGLKPSRGSIMISTRAFDSSANVGKALIGTDHRADMFIDKLRTVMAVQPTFMDGLVGNVDIPLLSGSSTVNWVVGLNSDAAETKPATDSITLSPKKLTGYVDVGLDLLTQGTPDATNIVLNDLFEVMARKLENTILKGATVSTLTIPGLAGTTGVKTVVIADVTKATWQDMLKFEAAVSSYANMGNVQFILSGPDRAMFKGISKDTGSGRFICESNEIDGYKAAISGELASGDIFFGDFSRILVGRWGGLEVMIDPYSLSKSGGVRLVVRMICDIAVRQPEAFVKRTAAD